MPSSGVTANSDYIYVSKGSGSTTGAYTMLTSQTLVGAGATLTVGPLTVTGSSANTPTLSGKLTLATGVSVSGIDMSTGTSDAIAGTTLNAINVSVRNLTTSTGIPVNVTGDGSGTGTMTFTQINANGAANGVVLTNYDGTFTVNGDGTNHANGSGGVLQGITGSGMTFTNVTGAGVTLKSINIGISSTATYGVLLDDNTTTGTLTAFNVTGGVFTGANSISQLKALLQLELGSSGTATADVEGSFFNNSSKYGFYATAAGTSHLTVTLNDSGFGTDVVTTGQVANPGTVITNANAIAIGITNGASGKVDYTVTDNTFWGSDGNKGAIYAVTISGATNNSDSRLSGSFTGNKIGKTGTTSSGCANNCGALGLLPGTNGLFSATVTNNDIRQVNSIGINFKNEVTAASGNSKAIIQSNNLSEPDTTGSPLFQRAIVVDPGNSGGSAMTACADVGGSTVALENTISGAWQTGNLIRVTTNNTTGTLYLPGLTPTSGATATDVSNFLQGRNLMVGSSVNTTVGTGPISGSSCPF
jgi:hypothetical protein